MRPLRRPYRVVTFVSAVLLTGGFAAGLSAAPASAVSGPVTSAGCSGIQCWAQLGVKLSQPGAPAGGSPNTGYSAAAVPPPACWYGNPISGAEMAATKKQDDQSASGIDVVTILPSQSAVNAHAKATNGAWYQATGDPNDPNEVSCIQQMAARDGGFIIWIPNGNPLPQPGVTPQELADYAYSQMILPSPAITLNPQKTTFVTLPTFVRANVRATQITATLGNLTVTVTATPTGLAISAPGATAYENGTAGKCLPQGSTASAQDMNKAGAGGKPDCGFVFQSPSSGPVPITASETWTAAWNGGALPQQPTPTAANPAPTIQVNEIQSVSGPGSNG